MKAQINFSNLVERLLPGHKRMPRRLKLLQILTGRLQKLFKRFDQWRKEIRREINMTSQVGVLEGYLRHKYGDPTITIATYMEEGVLFGLSEIEPGYAQSFGATEPSVAFPIRGEVTTAYENADFIVFYTDADPDKVSADIERYKLATITHKMIEK